MKLALLVLLALALAPLAPLAPLAAAGQCVRYDSVYACEGYEDESGVPTYAEAGARRGWAAETPAVGDRVSATSTPILVSFIVTLEKPSGAGETRAVARPAVHVGDLRAGDPASVTLVDTDGDGFPEDFATTPAIGPLYWPRLPHAPLPDANDYVPRVSVPRIILPGLP